MQSFLLMVDDDIRHAFDAICAEHDIPVRLSGNYNPPVFEFKCAEHRVFVVAWLNDYVRQMLSDGMAFGDRLSNLDDDPLRTHHGDNR